MLYEDAIETTRELSRDHGLLVGISSGANVWGARQLAARIPGNTATVLKRVWRAQHFSWRPVSFAS